MLKTLWHNPFTCVFNLILSTRLQGSCYSEPHFIDGHIEHVGGKVGVHGSETVILYAPVLCCCLLLTFYGCEYVCGYAYMLSLFLYMHQWQDILG